MAVSMKDLDRKRDEAANALIDLAIGINNCHISLVREEATGIPFTAKQAVSLIADYTITIMQARKENGTL